jgi:hypothetical protein
MIGQAVFSSLLASSNLSLSQAFLTQTAVPGAYITIKALWYLVPNQIFLLKAERFVKKAKEKISEPGRNKFAQKLRQDRKKQEYLYEFIPFTIDSLDERDKVGAFAKITASLIEEKISWSDYIALTHALKLATMEDLTDFSQEYFTIQRLGWRSERQGLMRYQALAHTCLVSSSLKKDPRARQLIKKAENSGKYPNIEVSLHFKASILGEVFAHILEDLEDYFVRIEISQRQELNIEDLKRLDRSGSEVEFDNPIHAAGDYFFGRNDNLIQMLEEKFDIP